MLEEFLSYLRSLGLVDTDTCDPDEAIGEYKVYKDTSCRVYVGPPNFFYNTTRPRALTYDPETQKWSWWNPETNERFDDNPAALLRKELRLQQEEQQERVQYALEQMSLSDDLLHAVVDAG